MEKSEQELMSESFKKIYKLFGEGTSIGRDFQRPDASYCIKVKAEGNLIKVGYGKTWDEAIADVKEVRRSRQ